MKSFKEEIQEDEEKFEETKWVNKSTRVASFKLMLPEHGKAPFSTKFRTITLKPEQSVTLPSYFDDAIRTQDKNGKVIGGLCPWLRKDGEKMVEMEECLDYEAIAEKLELEKLAIQVQKEDAMKDAIKVQAERKAAEKSKQKVA